MRDGHAGGHRGGCKVRSFVMREGPQHVVCLGGLPLRLGVEVGDERGLVERKAPHARDRFIYGIAGREVEALEVEVPFTTMEGPQGSTREGPLRTPRRRTRGCCRACRALRRSAPRRSTSGDDRKLPRAKPREYGRMSSKGSPMGRRIRRARAPAYPQLWGGRRRRRAPHRPRRGEACAPTGAVHSGTGNVTHSIGSGSICRRLMSPSDQNPAPISIRHQSPPVRFPPCATLRPNPAGSIGRPACESALDLVPVPCHACPMNGPVLRSSTNSTAPARQASCSSAMWTKPSKPRVRRRADTSRALVFGLRLSRRVIHFNSPCGLPAVLSGRVPAVPPARTRRGAGVGDGGRDVARNGRVARPEPRPERR